MNKRHRSNKMHQHKKSAPWGNFEIYTVTRYIFDVFFRNKKTEG